VDITSDAPASEEGTTEELPTENSEAQAE